jgi:hypothetical protein
MADSSYTNSNNDAGGNVNTSYNSATELADLGRDRYDHDTAAVGDRDHALFAGGPVNVRQGRASAGMGAQVFAWNTFQYETEDRNEREELKGDLHGGQLHRQNRAARGELQPPPMERAPAGGRGRGARGRAARERQTDLGPDGLQAGMKPDYDAPPLAKGIPEELSADMFWDGPIT